MSEKNDNVTAVPATPVTEEKAEPEKEEGENMADEAKTDAVLIDDDEEEAVNDVKDDEAPDMVSEEKLNHIYPQIGAGTPYQDRKTLNKDIVNMNEAVADARNDKMVETDESRVFGTFLVDEGEAVNEARVEEEEKNWKDILRFQRGQRIVWGRISGIHHYEAAKTDENGNYVLDENNQRIPETKFAAEVTFDRYPNFIAYIKDENIWTNEQYFGDSYRFFTGDSTKARVRREAALSAMLGAKIPMLITSTDRRRVAGETGARYIYTIAASRKAAMDIMMHVYFFNNKGNGPKVDAGTVYNAHVLTVNANAVEVECCGVETWITAYNLTGRKHVEDCRDEVATGQTIKVKLVKFHANKKGDPIVGDTKGGTYPYDQVYLKVSGRSYDTFMTPPVFKNLTVGDTEYGTVAAVNYSKRIYSLILDNKVMASVPFTRVIGASRLEDGDRVIFTIERKSEDRGFVTGRAELARK